MKATNIRLYHFHNKEYKNKLWREENIIKVDEEHYESLYLRDLEEFTQGINLFGFNFSTYNHINKKIEKGKKIENTFSSYLTRCINVERALEEYRKIYYPELPSRYNCMFLCDEDSIEHWNNIFKKLDYSLFEVEASGNLFKTSEIFIPSEIKRYEEYALDAAKYWNPSFETQEQEEANEYLFNGIVKVIKKIR